MQLDLPAILRSAYDLKLPAADLSDVLTALVEDSENFSLPEGELDYVAALLHNFYSLNSLAIKADVLKIFLSIEMSRSDLIVEKYHVDIIIAESIARPRPDPPPKVDTEKAAAFSYIYYLLNYHNLIPRTVLTAIISLVQQPDKFYESLAIAYLCDAILSIDMTDTFPEIFPLIINYIQEKQSPAVCSLITYGLENRFSVISDPNTLRALITPYAYIVDNNFPPHAADSLLAILRTWPGLLIFGIRNKGIKELIQCFEHSPPRVSSIISSLIKPCIQAPSLISGFCGTLIYIIQNSELPNIIHLYTQTHNDVKRLGNNLRMILKNDFATNGKFAIARAYDYSNSTTFAEDIASIVPVVVSQNPNVWDWQLIKNFLTYVIPYSSNETLNVPKQFYTNILEYFGSNFLTLTHQKVLTVAPVMMSLIRYLIKFQWGTDILDQDKTFTRIIRAALLKVASPKAIEFISPIWSIIDMFAFLLSNKSGVGILSRSGYLDEILAFGNDLSHQYNFEMFCSKITFTDEASLTIPVFSNILLKASRQFHQIALNILKKKREQTEDYATNVFQKLIIPYAFTLNQLGQEDKLADVIHFICDIVSADKTALSFCANTEGLHPIFSKRFRSLYPYILSHENALKYLNLEEEIEWWIGEGKSFVESYDAAYDFAFSGKEYTYPVHLFGELAQTRKGCGAISGFIEKVFNQILSEDIVEIRSAILAIGYFASSPYANAYISSSNIVKRLIESILPTPSPILLGTLIASLSMFQRTQDFITTLESLNWKVFYFSNQSCVIPNDFDEVLVLDSPVKKNIQHVPNIPGKEKICNLIKGLSNTVVGQDTIDLIQEYEPKSDFKTPDVHVFVGKVLGEYAFSIDRREIVEKIVSGSSLMELPANRISAKRLAMGAAIAASCKVTFTAISQYKVPNIPHAQISKKAPQLLYPEVYLSDDDFQNVLGTSRTSFYFMPAAQQTKLRQKIFDSPP